MIRKLLNIFNIWALPRAMFVNRSLLWQMTVRGVQARYKGSVLGLLWSFILPLVMLGVYTFVFSWVMGAKWGVDGTDWGLGIAESRTAFAIIMLCGLALFNLFSESVTNSATVAVSNQNLIKKVIFPLEVLPFSQVLSVFILGIPWMVILFLGVVSFFGQVSLFMLLMPLVLLPLFLLSLGLSYFVASLGVYIKDTQYVVNVAMQLLFWAVPIVYPVKLVKDKLGEAGAESIRYLVNLIEYNPLAVIIEQARMVFVFGRAPDWLLLGGVYLVSGLVMQIGYFWFVRTKKGFSDVL